MTPDEYKKQQNYIFMLQRGSGKTVMAHEMLKRLLKEHPECEVTFHVPQ